MASDPPSCRLLGGDLRRYAPTLPAQQATGKTEFTERTIHNLCTDLERMPVEDASVKWPEEASPHQPVARLVLPPQDAYSAARQVYGDDILSFTPWHTVAAHRPLGSIMRVRKAAYERSSLYRHTMNQQPRIEPASLDEVPQ